MLKIHPDPLQTALLFIHESVRENGMNEAIDIDRLIPAWQGLRAEAPIGHIESEGDYQQLTLILDRLLDVVRDDGTHPLYSLVTLIGDLLEAYEANLEPLNNQPLPDAGYNNWHS